jgi:hypothetical protein
MHKTRNVTAIFMGVFLVAVTFCAVFVRYILFSRGILYGEATAKMASLMVAGIVVLAGCVPLQMLRSRPAQSSGGKGAQPATHATPPAAKEPESGTKESIVATVAAILGLAVTAFSLSEILAPNTPVEAAAPACAGAPVYGARFFAETLPTGDNSRSGPGREYEQVNRYGGNCTLGFDGYCIGPPEQDFRLGTPDQRWLLVHRRDELIASAVVQSQTAESALGTKPSPICDKLGGLPQPTVISAFTYDTASGHVGAIAAGAAAVGYGLATAGPMVNYRALPLGTTAGFAITLPSQRIASLTHATDGHVWLGAAICLADNVPVTASLKVLRLTLRRSRIISETTELKLPQAIRPHLAEIACNSSG